jgi:hypothetical protein
MEPETDRSKTRHCVVYFGRQKCQKGNSGLFLSQFRYGFRDAGIPALRLISEVAYLLIVFTLSVFGSQGLATVGAFQQGHRGSRVVA